MEHIGAEDTKLDEQDEETLRQTKPRSPSSEQKEIIRVFLCHASEDKLIVEKLYHRLKNDGFDPWFDQDKLKPGQDWNLEIQKTIENSDAVIVCLSNNFTKKGYINKELKYILEVADEYPEGAVFLIPLKLEQCDIPRAMKKWQWVDYFEDQGYDRLVSTLREIGGK